ncbi:TonB-dependent receptor [Novosphingobium lentum]|uniref:TonB-dependent receptor n=1 Tax=Novosphingobium lentum TaxID=145287 RepID=UPI000829EC5F|nr:TonB-dependent receptor [Novosphingobium lentum]
MKKLLMAGTAILVTMVASPAFAQDTAPQDAPQANTAQSVDKGEIIVTATRSETRLSKTPVAVSAITGDALRSQGITSPTNLSKDVPNLSIDRTNGLQITIRGITSTDGTEKGDPSAAFLLDGVYLARPQEADVSFFDVQRVEVLRGPQGTLYGRNTTAGLVNVITNKPELGKLGFGINGGYGNYKAYNADGYVNVPLGDIAALRVAGSFDQRDNYLRALPGDPVSINPFRKSYAGRVQLLIKPNDRLSITLRADYARLKGTRITNVRKENFFKANPLGGDPLNISQGVPVNTLLTRSAFTPLNPGAVQFGAGNSATQQPTINNKAYGFEGELNYDFGPATLTYIGSYRRYFANENQLLDFAPGFSLPDVFNGNYKQQQHEVRLTANDLGPLKLQAGFYYFKEDSAIALYLFNFVPGVPVFGFPQATKSHSTAEYVQATYAITPTIRLTGGARYTNDYKFRYGHTVDQQTLTFNPATDQRFQNSATIARIKHTKFTFRVGLDADLGSTGLVYASVATGYKAGGFNDGCEAGTTTSGEACNQARPLSQLYYQPETLTAYEVGIKDRFFNDMVRVSADVFHYEYKNLQLSQIAPAPGGGVNQVTQNAASARITGLEFEATINPSPRNKIDIAYTYTKAKYVAYCPLGFAAGSTTACSGPNYAGRPLDRTPRQTVSAGYTYTLPFENGANVQLGGHIKFSGQYVLTDFGSAVQYRNPSYHKSDVSITFNAPDNRFYVQGFGSNLENAITLSAIDGFGNVVPQDPRTYGVRAGFKF